MSSAGRCIARSTSSGMVVGPGIARNSRPERTTIVFIPFWVCLREGMQGNNGKFKLKHDDNRPKPSNTIPLWHREKRLSPGLAAARGLGLVDRAEPARALADLHPDLRVPAAGGPVIDAFAGTVDVALDGAVGRGRHRSGRRSQQDRMGVGGRFGGPENSRLLVADAPVPGC